MEKRRICIVTTTRADWGLLCPLARRLQADSRCELSVVAGNMHLDPRYGMTVNEIEADGFHVAARVPLTLLYICDSSPMYSPVSITFFGVGSK